MLDLEKHKNEEIKENFYMERLKKVKKPNSLIRGKLQEFSLEQIKMLNSIYGLLYKHYLDKDRKKFKGVSLSFNQLLEAMGYKTDEENERDNQKIYNQFKDPHFTDILDKPIIISDYIDENGQKYFWYKIYLFTGIGVSKDYKNTLNLKINEDLFKLFKMIEKENFTYLNLLELNKNFNSKFQYRLYEYLKSYENLKQKFITIGIEEFNEIFEEKQEHLSVITRKIQRNLSVINEKTELKVELSSDKKRKSLTFSFKHKTDREKNKESHTKRTDTKNSNSIDNAIKEAEKRRS